METKANYLLIGAFTLAGILGAFLFVLWLAKVNVDKQYAYYDILFDDVSGLSTAGDVRYNGLPVGQVTALNLDKDDPSKVRVKIQVDADTPVKTDTTATLESQGVTGVSYIDLSGGSTTAKPMQQDGVIKSKRSALQSIFKGAPELMTKAVTLLEDLDKMVDQKNREAVTKTLANLESASGRLNDVLSDVEGLSGDIRKTASEVSRFSGKLGELSDTADTTLKTAQGTLTSITDTSNNINTIIKEDGKALVSEARDTIATINSTVQNELPALVEDVRGVVKNANTAIETVGLDISRVADRIDVLSSEGSTALSAATVTIENANKTLSDISGAMDAAKTTLDTADQTFTKVNKVIDEDVDAVVSDVRKAVGEISTTVQTVTQNVDQISQELLSASKSASELIGTVDGIIQENRVQVSAFLRVGLPQFQRFIEEARRLVVNLERLSDKLESDPARFFFGTQGSEYRR
ncbi:MlaD family protein [Ruegeria sp. 2012CJ41-6]|uniref:MlaD family protein n=1 Tax=Ruegeria spongiae TaxID=2942209 RepID=A0ABT0Q7R6_9RHOB|nr:MlaD family protein [Ruegeria spongiae]MCL6285452.1 MlaD family protein [Ruegeria spongiae]